LGLSRKDQLIERCTVPVLGKVATQCWVPLPGDRAYKLPSSTTSDYGRYVKSLGELVTGL